MKNELQSALSDIVNQLNLKQIRYCLVGGLAASLRGRIPSLTLMFFFVLVGVDVGLEQPASFPCRADLPQESFGLRWHSV